MQNSTPTPVFNSLADPAFLAILKNGGVGVLLTDTVYGLVGAASIPETAKRVIDAKGRKYKPGTLIAATTQQLIDLGVQAEYVKAAQHYWPAPLTAVLPTKPGLEYLDHGKKSLAVRIPDNADIIELLNTVGPLVTTSANRPNEPVVKDIREAQAVFGDRIDFYVDGGRVEAPVASTIIRLNIEVLRPGAVEIDLEAV